MSHMWINASWRDLCDVTHWVCLRGVRARVPRKVMPSSLPPPSWYIWRDSFIHMCGMNCSYVTWLMNMWRDSWICDVTHWYRRWLIYSYVWYELFIRDVTHWYLTWLMDMWCDSWIGDVTHGYVTWLMDMWRHSSIHMCVTWLIWCHPHSLSRIVTYITWLIGYIFEK